MVSAVESDDCKIARLVTYEYTFTQIFRIDDEETFPPVTSHETIRLLLSLAMLHVWEIEALDVKTAYLFGELDEEIYMDQPEFFFTVQGQEKRSID